MEKEDKELLLKDLCARLPYGVKVAISHFDEDGNLKRISEPKIVDGYYDEKFTGPNCYGFSIREVKPYLRPMSSMTYEEKQQFNTFGFEVIDHINANRELCPKYQVIETSNYINLIRIVDWLNAHYFDYRGLIPIGLAIEAPEGMYNLNK